MHKDKWEELPRESALPIFITNKSHFCTKLEGPFSFLCVPPVARRDSAPNYMKWRSYLFLFHTRLLCLCLKRVPYAGRKSHSASTEITHNAKKRLSAWPCPLPCYPFIPPLSRFVPPPTHISHFLSGTKEQDLQKWIMKDWHPCFMKLPLNYFEGEEGLMKISLIYLCLEETKRLILWVKCIQRWTPG